ncbi:MAG: TIGR03435 family protein [Candidatus Solibacter usitatus]|nr:TIGR03435 family protein [Candidatus Solibacter usitatus]
MYLRLIFAALALIAAALAQQAFEVASIKPNQANDHRIMMSIQPGGFKASGITTKMLISQAFGVKDFQVTNTPGWVDSERFDINAKVEGATGDMTMDKLRPLMQALLLERFQLKYHKEPKELPVYALVMGKNGHKMKAVEGGGKEQRGQMKMGRGQLSASAVGIAMIAQNLSRMLGRDVIDKTGLTGNFDFNLEWTPEPGQGFGPGGHPPNPDAIAPAGPNGPSIFTAVQEQLGLRLESQKGMVDVIVIDNVSKPTEN